MVYRPSAVYESTGGKCAATIKKRNKRQATSLQQPAEREMRVLQGSWLNDHIIYFEGMVDHFFTSDPTGKKKLQN